MMSLKVTLNITKFLFICLMATACAKPRSYYPELDKGDIILEQQKQQELVDRENARKEKMAALRLAAFEKRLQAVGTKIKDGGITLCARMTNIKGGCVYDFYVFKDKDPNAYADGNKIYITETMMSFAKSDEELAIVLGHEYAHNVMGHVKAKKTNAMIGTVLGTVVDVAASTQGISTSSTFRKAASKAGSMSFSKEFEKEADYIGLYITALAGYNISKAPEFWRKMSLQDSQSIYIGITHPNNPERYLGLEKTVAEITRKQHNGAILAPNLKD